MKVSFLMYVVLFMVACSSDYEEPLGGGYLFVATNRDNHYIVKGFRSVVDTNIIDYKVKGNYVVGYRTESIHPDVPLSNVSGNYGYFIFNKDDVKLIEGLSRAEYLQKAKFLGIDGADQIDGQ